MGFSEPEFWLLHIAIQSEEGGAEWVTVCYFAWTMGHAVSAHRSTYKGRAILICMNTQA